MQILGLDLGTNSIGWAIVDEYSGKIINFGVHIFQEGADKDQKENPISRAQERTQARGIRRRLKRVKKRKVELLEILSENGMSPKFDVRKGKDKKNDELRKWLYKEQIPVRKDLAKWFSLKPYEIRSRGIEEEISLQEIGRALYHIAQRRGFKSSRIDKAKAEESEFSKEPEYIKKLIEKYKTLGNAFYHQNSQEESIRNQQKPLLRSRLAHEAMLILEKQISLRAVGDEERATLEKVKRKIAHSDKGVIFRQRALKSQKGAVGSCKFETGKKRIPSSHPLFEEFRMWQFLRNIRMNGNPLTGAEIKKILPLFYRKRSTFPFEDIMKKLVGKQENHRFGYGKNFTIPANLETAKIRSFFGKEEWNELPQFFEQKAPKGEICQDDIWHILYASKEDSEVIKYGQKKLGFEEEKAQKFSKVMLGQGYGSLSKMAIKKILPMMKEAGFMYSDAVFIANVPTILSKAGVDFDFEKIKSDYSAMLKKQSTESSRVKTANAVIEHVIQSYGKFTQKDFGSNEDFLAEIEQETANRINKYKVADFESEVEEVTEMVLATVSNRKENYIRHIKMNSRIDNLLKSYLEENYGVSEELLAFLYHPSDIEIYPKSETERLQSPKTNAFKNPVVMRALHRVKDVVNALLEQDLVTPDTPVHVELSRDLNDMNKRKAIRKWQGLREKENADYKDKLIENYKKDCGKSINPTENDIVKYRLWVELEGIGCPYSEEGSTTISLCDLFGDNPKYDIEHIFPRSRSCDNSLENKTLCEVSVNRDVKRNQIPSEMANHDEILVRIETWKKKYEKLEDQISSQRLKCKNPSLTAEAKSDAIVKLHLLKMDRDYWKGKYFRFTAQTISGGFKNSQLVDTGSISKYTVHYLKSVFDRVYAKKGTATDALKEIWSVKNVYEEGDDKGKKNRDRHSHHAEDAIITALLTFDRYKEIAEYYRNYELYKNNEAKKPKMDLPWGNFRKDFMAIDKEVLVTYSTPHRVGTIAKKLRRKPKNNQIIYKLDENGNEFLDAEGNKIPQIETGDSARGQLHKDTFYGKIQKMNKGGSSDFIFRITKPLTEIKSTDVKKIVDDNIREIVQKVFDEKSGKELEKALEKGAELRVQSLKIDNGSKKGKKFRIENFDSETLAKLRDTDINNRFKKEIEDKGLAKVQKDGFFIKIRKVKIKFKMSEPIVPEKTHSLSAKNVDGSEKKPYKKHYYSENAENIYYDLYEGVAKGKIVRDFEMTNNFNASYFLKESVNKPENLHMPFKISGKGKNEKKIPFKATLKKGDLVLIYDKNMKELSKLSDKELSKRLYRINSFEKDGRMSFYFHLEARAQKDIPTETPAKAFLFNEKPETKYRISKSNLNIAVEGIDFKMDVLGKVEFLF
jgi:CRISPR-associated endonuclease Csn1